MRSWQLPQKISSALQIQYFLQASNSVAYPASSDVPALYWCPTNTWKPGVTVKLTSRVFGLQSSHIPNGLAYMSMAILPLIQSSDKIMKESGRRTWLPMQVVDGSSTVKQLPGSNALELEPMTIVS